MPRVQTVKKAQKSKRTRSCHRCGHVIQPGESYKHWKFRTGGRGGRMVFACSKPECAPKASDLTQSPHLSAFYAAQETAAQEMGGWEVGEVPIGEEPSADGLTDILNSYAEALREVGEGLTESAEAIEEGFGHATYQVEELQERAESYESAADEVEQWEPPSWDAPDLEDEEEPEDVWAEAVAAWAEEASSSASDAIYDVECY